MFAAQGGHAEIVMELAQRGALVYDEAHKLKTPNALALAYDRGHKELALKLLVRSASQLERVGVNKVSGALLKELSSFDEDTLACLIGKVWWHSPKAAAALLSVLQLVDKTMQRARSLHSSDPATAAAHTMLSTRLQLAAAALVKKNAQAKLLWSLGRRLPTVSNAKPGHSEVHVQH